MKYIFADLKAEFVNELKKLMHGREDCEFHVGDIKKLIRPRRAYVTPANVLLFQDSGIDRVYSREIFPDTERIFREFVRKQGTLSLVGKPYWPIGSAIMIEPKQDHFLIAAPTMLMPQPVVYTRNAYNATLAALVVGGRSDRIDDIVISAMCCGWGKMQPQWAATQVWWAIIDYEAGIGHGNVQKIGDIWAYKAQDDFMRDQPNFYENTEFKKIKHNKIQVDRS